MSNLQIIDTFPQFLAYWEQVQHLPMTEQIEAWATNYMPACPNLLQMQIDCYAEDGDDWREVAREHVFPYLADSLSTMQTAHDNLLSVLELVNGRCTHLFNFTDKYTVIIYVGVGCGAGWVTTYNGQPAILFGLENIAAEKWQERDTLYGLMAHEFGHLLHFHWRDQAGLNKEEGAWWQLYTEGFAQYCEQIIHDKPSWHMQTAVGDEWLAWCQANLGWLADEFVRRVDADEDMRPFFGSWYELRGYKQTGYFLGHELIRHVHQQANLHEIALLTNAEGWQRPLLAQLAKQTPQ